MKQRVICWLLKLLGAPQPVLPKFHFYAIVTTGERLAEVTTNPNRARAIAREHNAKAMYSDARVYRCIAVALEPR